MYSKMKSAKTGKVYSNATGKKQYKNKYGTSAGMDSAMIAAAVKAETARQVNKSIETQHSYALVSMRWSDGSPPIPPSVANPAGTAGSNTAMSGYSMIGLNQIFNQSAQVQMSNSWNNMLVFNLSALSQLRTGATSASTGYRVGNKANILNLTVNVKGWVNSPISDCTYYCMIARSKDGGKVGQATVPQLTTSTVAGLWKSQDEGPLAAQNTGAGIACPLTHYASMMRRNYEAWTFTSGAMISQKIRFPGGDESGYNAPIDMKMYHEFNEVWDYASSSSNSNLSIKGGDYFFYMWREGPIDLQARSRMDVHFTLAFKDA